MNQFIIFFFYCLTGIGLALSSPIRLADNIPPPPYPEILKLPDNTASRLNTFLHEGKLEEFYQSASRELAKIDDKDEKNQGKEDIQSRLWVFYYVSAAPFFQMDENPDEIVS